MSLPHSLRPRLRWIVTAAAVALLGLVSATTADAGVVRRPLSASVTLGGWAPGMDADPAVLSNLERLTGRALGVASVFRGDTEVFPSAADRALTAGGRRRLLVSWHLDTDRFSAWASGARDADLDRTAAAVADFGQPVYIRPWAEMNADWVDFQPTSDGAKTHGGTPKEFVAAWRHVVDRFRAAGAVNARWVFNPTADTYAGTTPVEAIWPGARYVDVLGMDGYNWGTARGLRWRSFTDVFTSQYTRLVALAPRLPVWVCETSSADPTSAGSPVPVTAPAGQTKGRWWREAFATTSMPRITTVVLFSAFKERDWRVDSSVAALAGLRIALATGAGSAANARRVSTRGR